MTVAFILDLSFSLSNDSSSSNVNLVVGHCQGTTGRPGGIYVGFPIYLPRMAPLYTRRQPSARNSCSSQHHQRQRPSGQPALTCDRLEPLLSRQKNIGGQGERSRDGLLETLTRLISSRPFAGDLRQGETITEVDGVQRKKRTGTASLTIHIAGGARDERAVCVPASWCWMRTWSWT